MKKSAKIQKKLEKRLAGHAAILDKNKNNLSFNPAAYTAPGSRNIKK